MEGQAHARDEARGGHLLFCFSWGVGVLFVYGFVCVSFVYDMLVCVYAPIP